MKVVKDHMNRNERGMASCRHRKRGWHGADNGQHCGGGTNTPDLTE
jgi:hypothetical protein